MATSATVLCDRCGLFDVRSLFIASESAPEGSLQHWAPPSFGEVRKPGEKRDGVSRFHQIQPNLGALERSASRCDLCAAIMQQVLRLRGGDLLTDEERQEATSMQPVYLDIDNWEPERSRAPYLIAAQYSPIDKSRGRTLAYFEVCALPEKVPSDRAHYFGRVQATSARDDDCMRLAKAWLDECTGKHAKCRSAAPSAVLPTGCLDVARDDELVYLIHGSEHSGHYAALSYCWGGERDLVLERSSLSEFESGLLHSRLPATLLDAVQVTRNLGLKYLWIDALCIIQDSAEDWAQEASRMSEIYRRSAVTIEAASASKAGDGFLKLRKSSQPYVKLEWRSIASSKVELLAPRTLSFGEQQISFECSEGYRDEAGSLASLPRSTEYYLLKDSMRDIRLRQGVLYSTLYQWAKYFKLPAFINTPLGPVNLFGRVKIDRYSSATYNTYWQRLMEQFSQRELTLPTDRLAAISGLAKELQSATGGLYCAGHWRGDMLLSLLWSTGDTMNRDAPRHQHEHGFLSPNHFISDWPTSLRSTVSAAPSWSWASVRGPVTFVLHDRTRRWWTLASVVAMESKPMYSDPLGAVEYGYVDIEGPVLNLPDLTTKFPSGYTWQLFHSRIRELYVRLSDHTASEFFQHHQHHDGQSFAVMRLAHRSTGASSTHGSSLYVFCLLLETCGDGKWRRLCSMQFQTRGFRSSIDIAVARHQRTATRYIDDDGTRLARNQLHDYSDQAARADADQKLAIEIAAAPWKTQRIRLS